jgi:ABC-type transporter lipoprotein component MlaA
VWPYLGPSTQRDAVGSVVDMAANPLGWLIGTQVALAATQMAVTAGTTVDAVDRLGHTALSARVIIRYGGRSCAKPLAPQRRRVTGDQ